MKRYKEFRCDNYCSYCQNYVIQKETQLGLMSVFDKEECERLYNTRIQRQKQIKEVINVKTDTKECITNKIKKINEDDIIILPVIADGNCMFRALLKSAKDDECKHLELRQETADQIKSTNYVDEGIFSPLSKEEYISNLRRNGEYTQDSCFEIFLFVHLYIK